MDRSPPGFSVHGIPQTRVMEWVTMRSSRGSSPTQGSNLCLRHLLHWQAGSLPAAPSTCIYKEGSGDPLPTCLRNWGWDRHCQPVQLGSDTSYLKHQHSPRVKVSALPASPWPQPPFRHQPNAQAVSWAFKHLPKGDIPPSPPQRSSQGTLKPFPR